MNNPVIADKARITALWDQWLLQEIKMTPNLKTCLKKANAIAKKQVVKEKKIREKAQEKAQINDIRRMILSNKCT